MNRPLHIWLAFTFCLVLVVGAMTWVSRTVLRLDRRQQEADAQGQFEERVRLALWRLDSMLTPLVAEESARPSSAYHSFQKSGGAYRRDLAPVKEGEILLPSPLLHLDSSNIVLHFQMDRAGHLTSPQVPAAAERALAVREGVSPERLASAQNALNSFQGLLDAPARAGGLPEARSSWSESGLSKSAPLVRLRDVLLERCSSAVTNDTPTPASLALLSTSSQGQLGQDQAARNSAEWNARNRVYEEVRQQVIHANVQQPALPSPATPTASADGVLQAVWLGPELVLARQVTVARADVVLGCWLNWTNLQSALVGGIQDLFPQAALVPDARALPGVRKLAALPAIFEPGPVPPTTLAAWSPARASLWLGWICVTVAGIAIAVLLHGAVSLSERRAAFVSAVTHELRTPLTTFKMYSEMLAEDMVPDEAKRRSYLRTLCAEASRLGHLVENVLAYARLEKTSARQRVEKISLSLLLDRIRPRLQERAEQAGMTLAVATVPAAATTFVQVDVSAVDQILFNLIDNACKYAAPDATERSIHLEALPGETYSMLRVRDHGQGISAAAARQLFKPFSKSAEQAATSAPGVGLGLALCRRLSRSMGGELSHEPAWQSGASFLLRLPTESRAGTPGASLT